MVDGWISLEYSTAGDDWEPPRTILFRSGKKARRCGKAGGAARRLLRLPGAGFPIDLDQHVLAIRRGGAFETVTVAVAEQPAAFGAADDAC